MGLENQGRDFLLSGSGFLDDHDVAGLVGAALEAAGLGKILQEGRHRAFVAGLSRNPGDLLEDIKYVLCIHIFTQSVDCVKIGKKTQRRKSYRSTGTATMLSMSATY